MDLNTLWSLRLGFSSKQSDQIKKQGIESFLKSSFAYKTDNAEPAFLKGIPRTNEELKTYKRDIRKKENGLKMENADYIRLSYDLRGWWIDKMKASEYPLREKMVLFWHNHYVAGLSKYKLPYWAYSHNMVLRENAFGNIKDITKKVLRTNAMVYYLDNYKNVKGKINENLSRELLELFTLGVGNYTEQDIKNGAKGLAGLGLGEKGAEYDPAKQDNESFTYLGKTGKFKSDEMVDIIFSHKNAPYFITRKLLKWFIYDNPPEDLVKHYGDYLREYDYEMQPFLTKLFTEEYNKPTAGSKIKDPLLFVLQLHHELDINNQQDSKLVAWFASNHQMTLFSQPNVKGWDGGRAWLTTQLYTRRNTMVDRLCKGSNLDKKTLVSIGDPANNYSPTLKVKLDWKPGNNKQVIEQLQKRLVFMADEQMQEDCEQILKHDFESGSKSAEMAVLALFNYLAKTPEFQLI